METSEKTTLTCPWWLLFTFDNPLRMLVHDPIQILGPYVKTGSISLDVGCGMGYFTLGLAELTGENGRVVAVDLQPQMLAGLVRRAQRAGLLSRVQTHLCQQGQIGWIEPVDFVLAFWMVHEVRRRMSFLHEISSLIKPGGGFLIVEPRIHVPQRDFDRTLAECLSLGLKIADRPRVAASRAVYLQK